MMPRLTPAFGDIYHLQLAHPATVKSCNAALQERYPQLDAGDVHVSFATIFDRPEDDPVVYNVFICLNRGDTDEARQDATTARRLTRDELMQDESSNAGSPLKVAAFHRFLRSLFEAQYDRPLRNWLEGNRAGIQEINALDDLAGVLGG